jgi:hypothetical protein
MARPRKQEPTPLKEQSKYRSSPPLTQEARVTQLISLAQDLAEQRLRDGTASAQEITYYLRRGSERDKLEREALEAKNQLLAAKTEAIKSAENREQLYAEVLRAFRMYGGDGDDEEYDDGEYEE